MAGIASPEELIRSLLIPASASALRCETYTGLVRFAIPCLAKGFPLELVKLCLTSV